MGKLNKNFYKFVYGLGGIPASYLESLSYEEQLLWFCKNLSELMEYIDNINLGLTFDDYVTMVSTLNTEDKDSYNIGQSIKIGKLGVYDLWVSGKDSVNRPYTYVSDNAILEDIKNNGSIQLGYYILKPYEGYTNLSSYATKNELSTAVTTINNTITTEVNTINNNLTNNYEVLANKVTSISASSTDDEYPTAKCMYNIIGNINSILATLTTLGGE